MTTSTYDRIYKYFGAIFPCTAGHKKLFSETFGVVDDSGKVFRGRVLVDVGFGTGEHLAYLASAGAAQVHGVEATHTLVAHAAAAHPSLAPFARNLRQGDMVRADDAFPQGFCADGVLCIGNTLPHAASRADAEAAVCAMARMLRARGARLLLQTVNYDRIARHRVTALPPVRGDAPGEGPFTFTREYDVAGLPDSVFFRTTLERPGEAPVVGEHRLLALTRAELERMVVAAARLKVVRVLGSFDGAPWDPDSSFSTIIVAERQEEVVEQQQEQKDS